MTDAQIAAAIRTALEDRAASGATGAVSVTIDGTAHSYSETEARNALAYWESRAARTAGTKRRSQTIDLRGAW